MPNILNRQNSLYGYKKNPKSLMRSKIFDGMLQATRNVGHVEVLCRGRGFPGCYPSPRNAKLPPKAACWRNKVARFLRKAVGCS